MEKYQCLYSLVSMVSLSVEKNNIGTIFTKIYIATSVVKMHWLTHVNVFQQSEHVHRNKPV